MLYKNKTDGKLNKVSQKLSILLSNCETSCNIGLQENLKARLLEKLKMSERAINYMKRLQDCKSCGGQCTFEEELDELIVKKNQQVQIVKKELIFFAYTHKADKIATPYLFQLNGISHEEKLMNPFATR